MGEAKLSAKKRFDMYKKDYGIKAHGMQTSKEAEKVIRFILTVKKDLMPDQMKKLVDNGLFDEGIKQGIAALMKTYTNIAKQSGKKLDKKEPVKTLRGFPRDLITMVGFNDLTMNRLLRKI